MCSRRPKCPWVVEVDNRAGIVPPGSNASDVQHSIKWSSERNATLDVDSPTVESDNGNHHASAGLSAPGSITRRRSSAAWDAWAAAGATHPNDHIRVGRLGRNSARNKLVLAAR